MVAAEDLKKYNGHVLVVDGISFSVTEGEVADVSPERLAS
jgi:ABC-type multidrug transport system ATPase subunit